MLEMFTELAIFSHVLVSEREGLTSVLSISAVVAWKLPFLDLFYIVAEDRSIKVLDLKAVVKIFFIQNAGK